MNKKIIIVIVVLICLFGTFFVLFNSLNNSKLDEKVMTDIRNSYDNIEKDISSYNSVRSDLVKIINNYYSSNLENDYDSFINNLKKEELLLNNIYKEVKILDDLCLDRLFKDSSINKICSDYKVYYETVVNVYMNDINRVNGFINSYNSNYNKNIVLYKSSLVSDYIDYNNDGNYLEREDINE